MKQVFHEITINTAGQGFYDFTNKTISWLKNKAYRMECLILIFYIQVHR